MQHRDRRSGGPFGPGDHPARRLGADARTRLPRHADVRRGHDPPVRRSAVGGRSCRVPGAVQDGAVASGDRRLRRRHPAQAGPSVRTGHRRRSPIGSASSTVPVLLAWGSRDPVFNDDFAADLAARLPNTVLHRFAERQPSRDGRSRRRRTAASPPSPNASSPRSSPTPTPRPQSDVCVRISETRSSEIVTQTWISGGCGRACGSGGDDRRVAFVDMATGDELRFAELGRADRGDRRRPAPPRTASRAIGWRCSRRRASTSSPPCTACGAPAGSPSSPIVGLGAARPRRGGQGRAADAG